MTTWAISMFRNEADVAEAVVRHMATHVDHMSVADNGSTDGTREILDRLECQLPLAVVDDADPAYRQSEKMTVLAEQAAAHGATWVVPFDADELWYPTAGGTIRDLLADLPSETRIVEADLYNHLCTALDLPTECPFESMVWRQTRPGPLPKVAFRWQNGAVIEQGNHGVQLPDGSHDTAVGLLQVRHFPVRSADHLIGKARQGAAAYAAAPDLSADMGAHWRAWGQLLGRDGEDGMRAVFAEHWWYRSPVDAGLVRDPAPLRRQ